MLQTTLKCVLRKVFLKSVKLFLSRFYERDAFLSPSQYNFRVIFLFLMLFKKSQKRLEYFSIFCLLKTPILTYETLFKRSNFLQVFMYFQNNKYSLNCNIVVFLFLYLLSLVNFQIFDFCKLVYVLSLVNFLISVNFCTYLFLFS